MRYLIIIVILPVITMAQSLSKSQEREFSRKKLSIETIGISTIRFTEDFTFGMGREWRKWRAYRGFSLITEANFFQIAGYSEESEMARSYRQKIINLTISGLGVTGIGMIIMTDKENIRFGYLVASFGIGLGMAGALKMNTNWAPYSLAADIASEYNYNLRESLKN